ncbi:MAG: glucose-6-phosphate isomerase family protein [Candidatus Omnitrophica bacterium]|nr:glucose-6-phosphate isomerase family protein [Candidatus Omnitrophota bacterium]
MMVALQDTAGIKVSLDAAKPELVFDKELNAHAPGIRTLEEMREVILDKAVTRPEELYYMYRDVYAHKDSGLLQSHKLRYDVTLIKPDMLGKEYMKTAGHYHPGDFGELYEVLYGRCFCLLQRHGSNDTAVIEEAILVKAEAGQKIVIPPGFGHILVNPGPQHLVTSNWVSSEFKSEYELYRETQGAAYFIIKENAKVAYVPNPNFKQVAALRIVEPAGRIEAFGLAEGIPMYPLIHRSPDKLAFLNRSLNFNYADVFVKSSGGLS